MEYMTLVLQLVEHHKKMVPNKIKKKILTKKEQEPIWKLLKERDIVIKQLDATIGSTSRPK
jgi:hypothetical protein